MIKSGGCEEVMHIFNHLTAMIEKSDVEVRLKTEVDEQLIRQEAPDAVVVAASSPYRIPDIPGIHRKNVFTIPMMSKLAQVPLKMFGPDKLASMSEKFFPVGKRIVIWGAGAEGAQCAEFMRKRGKDIVLVAEDGDVGGLIPLKYKERIEPWFNRAGVRVVRDATVAEFGKQGALLRFSQGGEELVPCDSMMVMLPEQRDPAFFDMAASLVDEVYGDSSTLGGENAFLKHALADGRRVGCLSVRHHPVSRRVNARDSAGQECMKGNRKRREPREVTAGRSQGFARDGPLFVSECNFEGKQGGKNNVG